MNTHQLARLAFTGEERALIESLVRVHLEQPNEFLTDEQRARYERILLKVSDPR